MLLVTNEYTKVLHVLDEITEAKKVFVGLRHKVWNACINIIGKL
jgi:hypothetical protein